MLKVAHAVRKLKVRVYVPISDFLTSLVGDCLTHEEYYEVDLAELEFCDAIFLVPGYEDSKGVAEERKRARELNLPEFNCIKQLENWLNEIPVESMNTLIRFADNFVNYRIRDEFIATSIEWFKDYAWKNNVGLNEVTFIVYNLPHRPARLEPVLYTELKNPCEC